MPIYEYKCENGHVFDVIQKMSDAPLAECEQCGAPAQRVLTPIAVHFKGSGFYHTDYGRKAAAGTNGGSSEGAGESKSADQKSGAEGKQPSDSKSGESKSGESKAKAVATE